MVKKENMRINIYIPEDLEKEMAEKVQEIGATRSKFICNAIRLYLNWWKNYGKNESSRQKAQGSKT